MRGAWPLAIVGSLAYIAGQFPTSQWLGPYLPDIIGAVVCLRRASCCCCGSGGRARRSASAACRSRHPGRTQAGRGARTAGHRSAAGDRPGGDARARPVLHPDRGGGRRAPGRGRTCATTTSSSPRSRRSARCPARRGTCPGRSPRPWPEPGSWSPGDHRGRAAGQPGAAGRRLPHHAAPDVGGAAGRRRHLRPGRRVQLLRHGEHAGHGFAQIGPAFLLLAPILGWIGVALSGSNTSTNALFGGFQSRSAGCCTSRRCCCPSLNSVGAEIGKPIAPQTASVGVSTSQFVRRRGPGDPAQHGLDAGAARLPAADRACSTGACCPPPCGLNDNTLAASQLIAPVVGKEFLNPRI